MYSSVVLELCLYYTWLHFMKTRNSECLCYLFAVCSPQRGLKQAQNHENTHENT